MKKPVIAIDVDDVLSSQVDVFIEFSNDNFGTSLTLDDFQEPGEYWGYYTQVWKISAEEGSVRFKKFLEDNYPIRQVVANDAKQAINRLKLNYDLEIVTSRHAEMSEPTKEWLLKNFPDTFKGINFTTLWGTGTEKVTKAMICKDIGASYLIDDNAEHCNLAAEAGIKSLLFGVWGWNTYQPIHNNVTRVNDWQAVLEYFNA